MSRSIPAFDPGGIHNERTGFIRTESLPLPPARRSRSSEEAGYTMWAGPKAIFINVVLPGIDLDALQIRVAGKSLVLSGALRPERNGRRPTARPSGSLSHTVELPYRVDADRAEVRKEKGLISIVLKKEADPAERRLESTILNSARRYFGADGSPSKNRDEEDVILQALDRYFAFLRGMNTPQGRRTA